MNECLLNRSILACRICLRWPSSAQFTVNYDLYALRLYCFEPEILVRSGHNIGPRAFIVSNAHSLALRRLSLPSTGSPGDSVSLWLDDYALSLYLKCKYSVNSLDPFPASGLKLRHQPVSEPAVPTSMYIDDGLLYWQLGSAGTGRSSWWEPQSRETVSLYMT